MGQSRNEDILENMLGANNVLLPPESANEKWLQKILGVYEGEIREPESRIEELLKELYETGGTGGQPYEGETTVTPSEQEQTLPTAGKTVSEDITIEAIPSDYYDTSDATGSAADVRNGVIVYGENGQIVGSMTEYNAVSGTISTKSGTVSIPEGYYKANGSVSIDSAEQAKIIAGNIRAGVTILGQAGSSAVVDTSDANALAADINSGKTAYVNGVKVTGTNAAAEGAYF